MGGNHPLMGGCPSRSPHIGQPCEVKGGWVFFLSFFWGGAPRGLKKKNMFLNLESKVCGRMKVG